MSRNEGPDAGASGPAEPVRRELDLFDLAALAWSQLGFMALVFIAVFLPLAFGAWMVLQPSYQAQSRLLVLLDEEDPTPGAAGAGAAFILDQVMQSEIEILDSDAVRRRALESRGVDATPRAVADLASAFSVERAPNATVLVAQFEADAPQPAANALNAIIEAYLSYRRAVLVDDGAGAIVERLAAAEAAAASAEAELRVFLNQAGLVDFEAERSAAVTRVTTLQTQLLSAEAAAEEAAAAARALGARLAEAPERIELYVENDATGQLLSLQIRRRELLARYQPGAPPVAAIEREIAALENFISEGGADGSGQRRVGANPVHQELESARLQNEAQANAQSRLAATLGDQLAKARAEADRLRGLAPEYDRLAREAAARAQAAERLSLQSAEAQARESQSPSAADAVRIVERAEAPAEPSSMRPLGLAAAFIAAAGLALLAGLLRGYVAEVREPGPAAARRPERRAHAEPEADHVRRDGPPARQAASASPQARRVLARVGEHATSARR